MHTLRNEKSRILSNAILLHHGFGNTIVQIGRECRTICGIIAKDVNIPPQVKLILELSYDCALTTGKL